MYSKSCITLILAIGVLFVVVPLVREADTTFRQPSPAKIVSVEGVTRTDQTRDMHGQLVEVQMPSRSRTDIRSSKTEQPSMSYAVGQTDGSVPATVVSVNQETNTARVLTTEGQTIVLELSAESLADMQIGDRLKLVVFQRP